MNEGQVLVTGATGFIGRHVTLALLEKGCAIRLLVRDQNKAERLFGGRVEYVSGGINDREAVRRAVEGCAKVFHVAGCYRFGPSAAKVLFRTNAEGTALLAEESRLAGVKRFLYVGTAGFLHQQLGGGHFTELELPRYACYKLSKLEAERRLAHHCGNELPWVVASPTCPMGPGDDGPTPTGRIVRGYLQGRYRADCRTGLNVIHVADLAEGILAVMERGRPGQRHVLGHENLLLRDMLRVLARNGPYPAPRLELPHALIDVLGLFGELADQLVPGTAERTQLCRETSWQSRLEHFFDLKTTWDQLCWRPRRGAVAALEEAMQWQCDALLQASVGTTSDSVIPA